MDRVTIVLGAVTIVLAGDAEALDRYKLLLEGSTLFLDLDQVVLLIVQVL